MVARVFGYTSGYPCPTITPKKGEIPASSLTRGGGLKRFCSELISSLRKTTTSELANPGLRAPRPDEECPSPRGGWSRGGGLYSHSDLLSPPFGGFIPGLSREKSEGGKQRCFRDRPEWRLLAYHAYCLQLNVELQYAPSGCGGS